MPIQVPGREIRIEALRLDGEAKPRPGTCPSKMLNDWVRPHELDKEWRSEHLHNSGGATAARLFLLDAGVQSINQLCGFHAEGLGDPEKRPYSNGSARFDLLPVPRRKTKADHIFLGVSVGFAQLLYPSAQGAKELSFINHPFYLEKIERDDHEQISWITIEERCGQSRNVLTY
jgi:hypothetical protein